MLGCLGSPRNDSTAASKAAVEKGIQGASHRISETSPLARFLSPISLSSNKEIGIKGEIQQNIAGGASPSPTEAMTFGDTVRGGRPMVAPTGLCVDLLFHVAVTTHPSRFKYYRATPSLLGKVIF